jgi:hypothetical protein
LKFARYQNYEPEYSTAVVGAVSMDPMVNLSEVLKQSLYDRKARDINGMMGRHLAKSVLKNKAKQKAGSLLNKIPGASLLGANKLVNKAIDQAVDNTEKADWRQWDMLPHSIAYGRIYLPEGKQNINVIFLTTEGKSNVKMESIYVKKGTNFFVLNSFGASEIEEPEIPAYNAAAMAGAGTLALNNTGNGETGALSTISVPAPSKYPTGDTEAIFTNVAGDKLKEGQYSSIVGNPENMLTEGTVTLTFERKKRFAASAVKMVILMNGEDKTEVKNGDTNKIQFEANGSPIILTMRNIIVKQEKNNTFNKRLRVLYYPTKSEETFIIDAGYINHKGLVHKSLDN